MSSIASPAAFAPATRPASPRLRITRRGRAVLLALVTIPLVVLALVLSLNGGGATASLEGSTVPFDYVTVQSGQSMWEVAESIAPAADPREVIDALMRLNGLSSADVYAGQELAVPLDYAR